MSSFRRSATAGCAPSAHGSATPARAGSSVAGTAPLRALQGWTGPLSARSRAVRGAALVGLSTQIAVAGHVLGGGEMPDLAALFSVAGLLAGVVYGLAKKRLRFLPVLGVMAGAQVLFHLLFTLSTHHPMPTNLTTMVLFHVLAAVGSAALLSHGDRLLFELCAAVQRLLRRVFRGRPAVGMAVGWTALVRVGTVRVHRSELATASGRRGPPQVS